MDKLNFNEFIPQDSIAWRKQIEKDLKLDLDILLSKVEDLDIEPFYHDPSRIASYKQVKQNPNWTILTYLNSSNKLKLIDLINEANNHDNFDFYLVSELLNSKLFGVKNFDFLISKKMIVHSIHIKSGVLSFYYLEKLIAQFKNLSIDFNPYEWQSFQSINAQFIRSQWESLANLAKEKPSLFSESHIFRIDTSGLQNSGANATLQIASACAMAIEIIEDAKKYQIDLQLVFKNISFEFAMGTDFFLEIAKLRAFRIVWQSILKSYGSDLLSSPIFCINSTLNLSSTEEQNNLLRLTSEAMSAVLGTCDYLTLVPYAFKNKTDDIDQTRLSRNIQHLLKSESYLGQISDASFGSYYTEAITQQLAEKSLEKFKDIETNGGYLVYLQSGKLLESCNNNKQILLSDLQSSTKKWISVNAFKDKSNLIENRNIESNISESQNFPDYLIKNQATFLLKKIDLENEFNKMEGQK